MKPFLNPKSLIINNLWLLYQIYLAINQHSHRIDPAPSVQLSENLDSGANNDKLFDVRGLEFTDWQSLHFLTVSPSASLRKQCQTDSERKHFHKYHIAMGPGWLRRGGWINLTLGGCYLHRSLRNLSIVSEELFGWEAIRNLESSPIRVEARSSPNLTGSENLRHCLEYWPQHTFCLELSTWRRHRWPYR